MAPLYVRAPSARWLLLVALALAAPGRVRAQPPTGGHTGVVACREPAEFAALQKPGLLQSWPPQGDAPDGGGGAGCTVWFLLLGSLRSFPKTAPAWRRLVESRPPQCGARVVATFWDLPEHLGQAWWKTNPDHSMDADGIEAFRRRTNVSKVAREVLDREFAGVPHLLRLFGEAATPRLPGFECGVEVDSLTYANCVTHFFRRVALAGADDLRARLLPQREAAAPATATADPGQKGQGGRSYERDLVIVSRPDVAPVGGLDWPSLLAWFGQLPHTQWTIRHNLQEGWVADHTSDMFFATTIGALRRLASVSLTLHMASMPPELLTAPEVVLRAMWDRAGVGVFHLPERLCMDLISWNGRLRLRLPVAEHRACASWDQPPGPTLAAPIPAAEAWGELKDATKHCGEVQALPWQERPPNIIHTPAEAEQLMRLPPILEHCHLLAPPAGMAGVDAAGHTPPRGPPAAPAGAAGASASANVDSAVATPGKPAMPAPTAREAPVPQPQTSPPPPRPSAPAPQPQEPQHSPQPTPQLPQHPAAAQPPPQPEPGATGAPPAEPEHLSGAGGPAPGAPPAAAAPLAAAAADVGSVREQAGALGGRMRQRLDLRALAISDAFTATLWGPVLSICTFVLCLLRHLLWCTAVAPKRVIGCRSDASGADARPGP